MKPSKKGFTLIEMMVVILIVGILAAVSAPMMRGRIEAAKWSEGNAIAGAIRVAVRTYASEKGISQARTDLKGKTANLVLTQLGFLAGDLRGTYFVASDFTIKNINATTALCSVKVSGATAGLKGNKTLTIAGTFK